MFTFSIGAKQCELLSLRERPGWDGSLLFRLRDLRHNADIKLDSAPWF